MENAYFVSVSGGLSSAATLLRCMEIYPHDEIFPVFCDTLWEDQDTYRFIDDLEQITKPFEKLRVGKTPADVSDDQHMIFNSRVAKCTQVLKTVPIQNYVKSIDADRKFMCIGFNMKDRFQKAKSNQPYGRLPGPVHNWIKIGVHVKYPLWFYPRIVNPRRYVEDRGLTVPKAYDYQDMGYNFTSNCGGGCFKAGVKYWRGLLQVNPERFIERMEWESNKRLDPKFSSYAILTRVINGEKVAFPLEELYNETMKNPRQMNLFSMLDDIDSDCAVECNVF